MQRSHADPWLHYSGTPCWLSNPLECTRLQKNLLFWDCGSSQFDLMLYRKGYAKVNRGHEDEEKRKHSEMSRFRQKRRRSWDKQEHESDVLPETSCLFEFCGKPGITFTFLEESLHHFFPLYHWSLCLENSYRETARVLPSISPTTEAGLGSRWRNEEL